jgi:tetratricopeptide (TPR) repeat protein
MELNLAKPTVLILLILFLSGSTAHCINIDSLFMESSAYYENKAYDNALVGYLELESKNVESPTLFFNIGNCYFKNGRIGYAILYYLRAKKLAPFDEDINANLDFARQFMPTRLEGIQINPVKAFLDMVVQPFTLNSMAWISSIVFIGFILLLAAIIYLQIGTLVNKVIVYCLLVLVLVSSGLTTYKYRTEFLTKKGVIVADETRVYSGPGEDNDVEFVGGFGIIFTMEKSSGDYYLVIFENQRKGWIKKSDVEII